MNITGCVFGKNRQRYRFGVGNWFNSLNDQAQHVMQCKNLRWPTVFGAHLACHIKTASDEDGLDALRRELEVKMACLVRMHDDS